MKKIVLSLHSYRSITLLYGIYRVGSFGCTKFSSPGGSICPDFERESGDRFVPVIIGISEARAVVFELNRIKPHRPGPHDLFAQLADYCRMFLQKIIIWKFEAGVYYAI